ncbi:hypothetical protein FSB78_01830 [Sphingomonas ginsenosidivorax]|uniref:Uncharacterized protein n=1 Tax=Sphingomonas ginsenosidivorax TaxID=862135 RepID=A0A5C6UCS3_9SPHN|nr:hypothetical protein [Sphingomonas ginsenosidivorax]TXC69835.1 hypothetical protein FSB78_01830 [Sphingomonas ginsenosidivorax]
MPLFSTPTQFAVLALLFIAGWLFGLASHPGGRKWKTRYLAERDAHVLARKDRDGRITASDARVAELERENARLVKAQPVVAPVTTTAAPIATRTVGDRVATRRSYAAGERRSWFDFNR